MSDLLEHEDNRKKEATIKYGSLPDKFEHVAIVTPPTLAEEECVYHELEQITSSGVCRDNNVARSKNASLVPTVNPSISYLPRSENTYNQLSNTARNQNDGNLRSRIVSHTSNIIEKETIPHYDEGNDLKKYVTLKKFWILSVAMIVLWIIVIFMLVPISFSFIKPKNNLILLIGQLPSTPAKSCADILRLTPSSPSGQYWIRSSNGSAVQAFCDMTRDCGSTTRRGWMKVSHNKTAGHTLPCFKEFCDISDHQSEECGVCASNNCKRIGFPTFGINYTHICGNLLIKLQYPHDSFEENELRTVFILAGNIIVWSEIHIGEGYFTNCTDTQWNHSDAEYSCHYHSFLGSLRHLTDNNLSLNVCGRPDFAVTDIDVYIY